MKVRARPFFRLFAVLLSATLAGPGVARAEDSSSPQPGFAAVFLIQRAAEAAGDFDLARGALALAVRHDPDNLDLVHRSCVMALNDGDYDVALAAARKVLTLEPKAHLAHLLLLAEAVRDGRMEAAAAQLAALNDDGLGQFLKPFLRAWLKAGQKDFVGARAALESVAQLASVGPLYQLHAGLLADAAGDGKAARLHYAKLSALGPGVRAVALMAGFYTRAGDTAARDRLMAVARRSGLEESLLEAVGAGAPLPEGRTAFADVFYGMASLLQGEGAPDVALPYAQMALMMAPEAPLVRLLVADLQSVNGRDDAAAENYRALAADAAASWVAEMRLAGMEARQGAVDAALARMLRLTAGDPLRVDGWVQLGDVRALRQEWAAALAAYEKAQGAMADAGDAALRTRLFFSAGEAWRGAGDLPRALEAYEAAVTLDDQQAVLLNTLGYLYAEQGVKLARAEVLLEKALALAPQDADVADSLGWVKFRQGEAGEAVRLLELAAEMKPYDPVVNDHLGDAYWAVGRQAEARFQWQRALRYPAVAAGSEAVAVADIEAKLARGLPRTQTAEAK